MSRKTHRSQAEQDAATADLPPMPRFRREVLQVLVGGALTTILFSLIFQPRGLWPLAFVCLVPWTVVTCRTRRAWLVHWSSFLFGGLFFLINLRWLMPVTGLGYAALAFYLALYWPLCAWALRTGLRHRVSPVWSLPVTWVASEFLRAWVMTGFPWLFLAHAFAERLWLIQISDLTGAYGVSFLAALVNGVVAAWLLDRAPAGSPCVHRLQTRVGTLVAATAVVGTLLYGRYRCSQTDFKPGPRVAVVQHDFPLISKPPYGEKPWVIFAKYLELAARAAAEKPDLLVLPETVWAATQNIEFLEVEHNAVEDLPAGSWQYGKWCHEATSAFARGDYAAVNRVLAELERRYQSAPLPRLPVQGGPPVTLVLGATSVETFPEATYPKTKRYNSALVYDPDGTQRRLRYDKKHLVPFGEVVPFRYGRLHWLYRWLNSLSPFSSGGKVEYSLTPGEELTVFELATDEGTWRFGTPICYEDVMPYLIRRYVWEAGRRRVDFVVNISNDGWFVHGDELPQHLAICVFRAVENRVGIARSVNTGISAFIDPNGRIYSVVERDGRRFGPGVIGYRVDRVLLDERASVYGRIGDVFADLCLVLTVILWFVAIGERWVLALRQRLQHWLGRKRHGGEAS